MNRLTIILVAIFSLIFTTSASATPNVELITSSEVAFTNPIRASRNAAVKIFSPSGGHGSGIYVTYKKHVGILTANHVVDEGVIYQITTSDANVVGAVIWRDETADLAFLITAERLDKKPIRLTATAENLEAGTKISYSGYPSSYELLSVTGHVSGFDERGHLIIQGFGWFGSSGAGIIDDSNRLVGIVTALPVEEFYGHPQVLEALILVTPIKKEHITQIGVVLDVLKQ